MYHGWAEGLTRILAYAEAEIDFPDEDLPEDLATRLRPQIEGVKGQISDHLSDHHMGERLRSGFRIAVIGAPNAGKSSLVNALARRDVAIVSDLPGTTRDVLEVHLNLGGYPVIISDTAGLRPEQLGPEELMQGHDKIEGEGIRRAIKVAEEADFCLLVFDGTEPEANPNTLALKNEDSILVINKSDQGAGLKAPLKIPEALFVSAIKGEGLNQLCDEMVERIKAKSYSDRDISGPTRARHRQALEEALEFLNNALGQNEAELLAEEVRLAVRAIGRITGRVDVEDLLDVIFRDFCIGK